MILIIILIVIFIIFILIVGTIVVMGEIKKKCYHDWELVSQKIYYLQYHKTYKCSKCGKRKYIEEWNFQ